MTFQEFMSQTRDLIEKSDFENKTFLCNVEQWHYEKSPIFQVYLSHGSEYIRCSTPEDCISKLTLKCQSLLIQTEMQISENVQKGAPFDEQFSGNDLANSVLVDNLTGLDPEFPFPEETPLGEQVDGGNDEYQID